MECPRDQACDGQIADRVDSCGQVIGPTNPSGGGGVNAELILSNCDTKVGLLGIELPITIWPPGLVTLTISLATSKGLGANIAPNTERVKSNESSSTPSRLHASPSWNFKRLRPAFAARLLPAFTRFLAISTPVTSAPSEIHVTSVKMKKEKSKKEKS
jgi:hypothetical protein